ncbi:MAG: AMP-binding protein, partial [Woeseiaceae bacterium]|nr:AMP-binding protein [Woeseiaceae bacterium]
MTESALSKPGSAPVCPSITGRLLRHAETDPDRDAIVTPGSTISYAGLYRNVQAQAQRFRQAGVSESSVVGIRCPDDAQHLIYCLAASHIGATSFALPSHESAQLQASIAGQCGATHIAGIDSLEPLSRESRAKSGMADEARLLFFTSGTTGQPKIVLHYDSDIVAQAHRHIGSVEERFACLASIEHNFAKRHRLYCVAAGASNVFLDASRESLVEQCRSVGVNVLHVSAFQAQELLAIPGIGELSDIRLKLGGSHVPLALRRQLRAQVTRHLQAGYGTTETGAIAFTDPDDAEAGESVGRPLQGIEVRVVSADRKPLQPGERGELAIRCEGMFRGYLDQPQLTAERLDGGWFYTGDIGYLDSEQRIHLSGRSDDMFMFNSMNIFPQEIESRICRFPGVREALVIPKSSQVHGNIPVAFVVFEDGVDPDVPALKAFIREHAGARSPRQVTVVESLPRSESGKISRREGQSLAAKSRQIRSALIGVLNADVIARLKPALIDSFIEGDTDIVLRGLGLDSYGRMEVMVMLEVEYGVVVTPEQFAGFTSLGRICDWVLSAPREDARPPA